MADIRITRDSIGIEEAEIVVEHEDVIVWMATVPKGTSLIGMSSGVAFLAFGHDSAEVGIDGLQDWTTFSEVSQFTLMVCSVKEGLGHCPLRQKPVDGCASAANFLSNLLHRDP